MPSLIILIALVLAAANLGWWWLADRLSRRLPGAPWWRRATAAFVLVQVGLLVWIIGGRAVAPRGAIAPGLFGSTIAFTWQMFVLPGVVVVGVGATATLSVWCAWRITRRRSGHPEMEVTAAQPASGGETTGWTRRNLLAAAVVAGPPLLTGITVGASLEQLQRFRVRRIRVALPMLPRELEGVRIASVADLHVGTFTAPGMLRRIVEAASGLDADLVVMPGDLINNRLADLSDALDAVAGIQSRYGTYLCMGNHDLIENGAEFALRTRQRANLLVDEARTVMVRGYPVRLLGLPWTRGEEAIADSVRRLAKTGDVGAFSLLMAHHPHAFDAAAEAGIALTFAGHTHGGQLMASEEVGFGPWMYRYWSGLYRKPERGGASLVVSNGVGHWYPLRIGAPAEVILATLERGEESRVQRSP